MRLEDLLNQNRLQLHRTSRKEVHNLMRMAERDLKDAKLKGLSLDRKFATAYNAVLQTASILLYCTGYRPKGTGHHFLVFQAMRQIMGEDYHELADYFDSCRAKRNITDYDYPGAVSKAEVQELIEEAEKFRAVVLRWLETHHPEFSAG